MKRYLVDVVVTLVALWPCLASALYDKKSGVVDLTPGNFEGKVKSSDAVWIVEFYAPW